MNITFPFKYNKVAALLMLAPLSTVDAATVLIAPNALVEVDSVLTVPVKLAGDVEAFPVELEYDITTLGSTTSYNLIIENADITPVIEYQLTNEGAGESIDLVITSATNADVILDANNNSEAKLTAKVIDENIAPIVTFTLSQLEADVEVEEGAEPVLAESKNVTQVSNLAGLVTVTANIADVNANDTHCVTFTWNDLVRIEGDEAGSECANTFTFDPAGFTASRHALGVMVAEDNTAAPFSINTEYSFEIIDRTTLIADTNQNGIPDSAESDSTVNDSTTLPIDDTASIQVATGLSLSLGDTAKAAGNNVATVPSLDIAGDWHYASVSTITDFTISGLQQAGQSASVVIPLIGDTVIPADAVYRKWNSTDGWFTFVEDANNVLTSAMKDDAGNCPMPHSARYTPDLTAGDNCIQLSIEDGGDNDNDGLANGIVSDPGVLTTQYVNTPPIVSVSTHGASSGNDFILSADVNDAEYDDITIVWEQLSGPTAAVKDASTSLYTAPEVEAETALTFIATVSDGQETVVSEEFTVVVTTVNLKPEHEIERRAGSFGWILLMLGGLFATRRVRK